MLEDNIKKWYHSKTLWVNFATIAVLIIDSVIGKINLKPEEIGTIIAVANIFLRFFTGKSIG